MVALLVGGGSGRASLLEGQQERGCLFLAECAASAVFSIPLRTGHGRACGGKEILEHLRVVRCEGHARCLPDRRRGAGQPMSLSRWKPRSRTDSSAGSPACASSQVTLDITTWLPCAVAAIRAARCTSMPMYPSSCRDGSPECRPILTLTAAPPGHACPLSARCAATQQATASVADSNTTKKLSPSVPISCPRHSDMASRSTDR